MNGPRGFLLLSGFAFVGWLAVLGAGGTPLAYGLGFGAGVVAGFVAGAGR